jgi:O-antigen ligase
MKATSTNPSSRLRRFGLVVGTGLTLVGLVSWYRGHESVPAVLWTVAAGLVLVGLLYPRALAPVERGWLAFGMALGWVNTRIILTLLFALVVTPVGAVMRLFRDPLDRRIREDKPSYWLIREPSTFDPKKYERQF